MDVTTIPDDTGAEWGLPEDPVSSGNPVRDASRERVQEHDAGADAPPPGPSGLAANMEEQDNGSSDGDDKCPICLTGIMADRSLLNNCFHAFCFKCVLAWAQVTRQAPTCPLCKASFTAIIHNIESDQVFEQFRLDTLPPPAAKARYGWGSFSAQRQQQQRRQRQQRRHVVDGFEFRRSVYAEERWAVPERNAAGQRVRGIYGLSTFRSNPRSIQRALPWLRRELKVLVGADHAEFVTQYVESLLERVDFADVRAVAPMLRPFLFGRTEHFLHEFRLFADSSLDVIAYDRHAEYAAPRHHGGAVPHPAAARFPSPHGHEAGGGAFGGDRLPGAGLPLPTHPAVAPAVTTSTTPAVTTPTTPISRRGGRDRSRWDSLPLPSQVPPSSSQLEVITAGDSSGRSTDATSSASDWLLFHEQEQEAATRLLRVARDARSALRRRQGLLSSNRPEPSVAPFSSEARSPLMTILPTASDVSQSSRRRRWDATAEAMDTSDHDQCLDAFHRRAKRSRDGGDDGAVRQGRTCHLTTPPRPGSTPEEENTIAEELDEELAATTPEKSPAALSGDSASGIPRKSVAAISKGEAIAAPQPSTPSTVAANSTRMSATELQAELQAIDRQMAADRRALLRLMMRRAQQNSGDSS